MNRARFTKLTKLIFAAIIGVSFVTACAPPQKREAQLTRAYRLIDAQRTDEAITLLEKMDSESNGQPDVRVALASAYAHKAGIRIQKLWKLVQSVKDSAGFFKELVREPNAKPSAAESIDEALLKVAGSLHRFARVAEVYAAIPNVDPELRDYLDQAILTLNAVDKPRPGDVVFRAILKIIQFKSSLAQNMVPDAKTRADSSAGGCLIDLERLSSAVAQQSDQLISILTDVAIVFPDQEKQLTETRMRIAEAASKLTTGTSSIIVFEAAARTGLKASVIDNNFGKLLKCGDESNSAASPEALPAASPASVAR